MSDEPLRGVVGVPVVGANFFGRDRELTSVLDFIGRSEPVLLVGPRRSGKTSLLWEVRNRLEARGGVNVLTSDFSAYTSADDAAFALLGELVADRDSLRLAELRLKAELGGDQGGSEPGDAEDGDIGTLQRAFEGLDRDPLRTVLLVDEALPFHGATDEAVRRWCRTLETLVGSAIQHERVSLVASVESTAHSTLVGRTSTPRLTRTPSIPLMPWDAATIADFLAAASDATFSPALCCELAERTAPLSPHEAQRLVRAIVQGAPNQRNIDEILARLTHRSGGARWRDFESSFSRRGDLEGAVSLLSRLAGEEAGATMQELAAERPLFPIARIAAHLVALGVLRNVDGRYSFASGLRRLRWESSIEGAS